MPTQNANAFPWLVCANLLAKPCSPPLSARRTNVRTRSRGTAVRECLVQATNFIQIKSKMIAPMIDKIKPAG